MSGTPSLQQIAVRLAERRDAWAAVRDGRSFVPALVLLEHPLEEVQARFMKCLCSAGIGEGEAKHFELRRLIAWVLESPDIGTYWGELAISWVEAGFPMDEPIAKSLENVASARRFSQNVRHRAFALAKRWARKEGDGPSTTEVSDPSGEGQ